MFWHAVLLILLSAVVIAVGYAVGGWLAGLARVRLDRAGVDPLPSRLATSLIRPGIVVVALVAGLDLLGMDLTSVVAVLGAATFAVGLALKDSLGNLAAGTILLSLRPFDVGDKIDAAGESGTLVELGLLATRLKGASGAHITVENRAVLAGAIRNHSRNGLRRVDVDLDLAPGQDLGVILVVCQEAAASVAAAAEDPAASALATAVTATGVAVRVSLWTASGDFHAARSAAVVALDGALASASVARAPVSPLPR